MIDADKKPFAEAMQMLCAAYRVEATKPLMAAYFIAMRDTTIAEAQAAVAWALGDGGKFMPTAHELREAAVRTRRRPWVDPVSKEERKCIAASWEGAPRLLGGWRHE